METEVKIEVADLDAIGERLRALGAIYLNTVDESNLYFDRDDELRGRGESLRLRQDVRTRLTWKGTTNFQNGVVQRPEVEITVGEFAATSEILERLGYRVVDRLAKRRATWRFPDAEVALDALSFGNFVEIEAPSDVVLRVARELGLDPRNGIGVSYRVLQKQRSFSA